MSDVLIIAEAGVNHNGDLGKAIELVDVAADVGADIVKFQTFTAENLVTQSAKMADYQIENTGNEESQWKMLKRLELRNEDYFKIQDHCKKRGIGFLSTGFDLQSLRFLQSMDMGMWKIPSGEVTNLPYLEFIGVLNQTTILSTGMATFEEVQSAVQVLLKAGLARDKLTVLHCSTDYPAELKGVHLRAMVKMSNDLQLAVGYSDHTLGIEVSLAAVALGASVIEKHFTLDKNLEGPDHKASLEPNELKELVRCVRNIEVALGTSKKEPSEVELRNRLIARKSIVASRDISAGEIYTEENVTTKRPGSGVSPMRWHEILGQKANQNFKADELIKI